MPTLARTQEVDLRYLRICREYAQLSRCFSRQVGAMLVNPDGIVIGMGVNGPPRGIKHCGEMKRCQDCGELNRDLHPENFHPVCSGCGNTHLVPVTTCPRYGSQERASILKCHAVHAEMNALLACGRTHNSTVGCSLYLYPIGPCKDCAAQMVQAGIVRLVFPESPWYDELGPWILRQSQVQVQKYPVQELDALQLVESPFAP